MASLVFHSTMFTGSLVILDQTSITSQPHLNVKTHTGMPEKVCGSIGAPRPGVTPAAASHSVRLCRRSRTYGTKSMPGKLEVHVARHDREIEAIRKLILHGMKRINALNASQRKTEAELRDHGLPAQNRRHAAILHPFHRARRQRPLLDCLRPGVRMPAGLDAYLCRHNHIQRETEAIERETEAMLKSFTRSTTRRHNHRPQLPQPDPLGLIPLSPSKPALSHLLDPHPRDPVTLHLHHRVPPPLVFHRFARVRNPAHPEQQEPRQRRPNLP